MNAYLIPGFLALVLGIITMIFLSFFARYLHAPNKGFVAPTMTKKYGEKRGKILAFIFGLIFFVIGIFVLIKYW
ncbi:MAG: hypothetical protein AABX07_03750 [Nanoarchaeota archaeon]